MRIDWGLCPFRGTVAASAGLAVDHGDANVLFGGIVGGLDVRTVEEHKEVVPIASQMFRESLVGRIGESAVQQRFIFAWRSPLATRRPCGLISPASRRSRKARACRRMA